MGYSRNTEIISAHISSYPLSLAVETMEYRWLLSGGSDGAVALYDLESALRQPHLPSSSSGFGGRNDTCEMFSIRHKKMSSLTQKHTKMISTVQWYPIDDGAFLSAGYDGKVFLWDANVFEIVHEFTTNNVVYRAKFHDDGRLIATGLANGSIRLCDCNSASSSQVLNGHRMAVTSVQWDPLQPFVLASSSLGWLVGYQAYCYLVVITTFDIDLILYV